MTDRSTLNEKLVTVPAGQRLAVEIGISDFLFFQTFPAGLTASLNDAAPVALPEGLLHKGPAGNGNFRALALVNATGSPLAARILYGQGEINVAGSVTLVGSIPLPAGAATAAKQDAQTALLTALNAAVAVVGDVQTITGSAAFANCRALSVSNTGAAAITVHNGTSTRTVQPGDTVDWPCVGPFAKYATFTVDASGSEAVVVTTV